MSERHVLTLRARWHRTEPHAGQLMASQSGRVVYLIVAVTKVQRAGDPGGHRFRLVCRRLRKAEVPIGSTVLPWLPTSNPRRRSPPAPRRPTAPMQIVPPEPVPHAVLERPEGERDIGPQIQHLAVKDRSGRVLRAVSVTVGDGVDPGRPNHTVRRARRSDPLQVLYHAGTVSGRGLDAGDMLRDHMERTEPNLSGARTEIHVAAFLRATINDKQLRAAWEVRRAFLALTRSQRVAVAWVCCGGTVEGLQAYRRLRRATVAEDVRTGLEALADFFFGTARSHAA